MPLSRQTKLEITQICKKTKIWYKIEKARNDCLAGNDIKDKMLIPIYQEPQSTGAEQN